MVNVRHGKKGKGVRDHQDRAKVVRPATESPERLFRSTAAPLYEEVDGSDDQDDAEGDTEVREDECETSPKVGKRVRDALVDRDGIASSEIYDTVDDGNRGSGERNGDGCEGGGGLFREFGKSKHRGERGGN